MSPIIPAARFAVIHIDARRPALSCLLLALLPVPGGGLFYDVIQPHQLPAEGVRCLRWDEAGDEINSRWATPGHPPANDDEREGDEMEMR